MYALGIARHGQQQPDHMHNGPRLVSTTDGGAEPNNQGKPHVPLPGNDDNRGSEGATAGLMSAVAVCVLAAYVRVGAEGRRRYRDAARALMGKCLRTRGIYRSLRRRGGMTMGRIIRRCVVPIAQVCASLSGESRQVITPKATRNVSRIPIMVQRTVAPERLVKSDGTDSG